LGMRTARLLPHFWTRDFINTPKCIYNEYT
jgi:hypothetical protein